jgi:hypothetical protein
MLEIQIFNPVGLLVFFSLEPCLDFDVLRSVTSLWETYRALSHSPCHVVFPFDRISAR